MKLLGKIAAYTIDYVVPAIGAVIGFILILGVADFISYGV